MEGNGEEGGEGGREGGSDERQETTFLYKG